MDVRKIIRESVARVLREEEEDFKSPLEKAKENNFKVKGKIDVSDYRKKHLHGKKRSDNTLGDNMSDIKKKLEKKFGKVSDNPKKKGNRKVEESRLRDIVRESVMGVLFKK